MRIKKIELIGFKSFADRTEIHLDLGVTCIVGPNGCGKSNISDALRWVFGERSAKLLRGTRMEDVIFGGTEFRKPMGFAEVSLYIDNEDHQLSLPYDEVAITRRIDRTGQSQYFINKTPCRLKDIVDLIVDTGMGSNSYSMIEQGKVDFVVNSDPQERRFLIEEAAGIAKFKLRKEEALRKLERTEENLLRIRDILAEVQKNIQYAERQAKRAEKYRLQFDELKQLEIKKAFFEISNLSSQKEQEDKKKQEFLNSLNQLEAELRKALTAEEEQKQILQKISEEETEWTTQSFETRSEFQNLSQRCSFNEERLGQLDKRLVEIATEKELLRERLITLDQELSTKAAEIKKLQEQHGVAESELAVEKSKFEEGQAEHQGKRAGAEQIKTSIFDQASQLAHVRNEWNHFKSLLERTRYEIEKANESQAKLASEKETSEKRKLAHRVELASLANEWNGDVGQRQTAQARVEEVKTHLQNLEDEVSKQRFKLQEIDSRIKLLSELDESSQTAERQLLGSLTDSKLQGKLIRSLREILEIEPGYEVAVEAILGSFAQGLVAEDIATAKTLMVELAQNHGGPCGIFVQNLGTSNALEASGNRPQHSKIGRSLGEVVKIQEDFQLLLKPVFDHVFMVEDFSPDDLTELLPLSWNARLVTRLGILLGPHSKIFFRNGKISADQGPFGRQSEIKNLKIVRESESSEMQTLEFKQTSLKEENARLEYLLDAAEEKRREGSIRKEALESVVSGLDERMAHLEEEIRIFDVEKQEAREEQERISVRLEELQNHIHSLEKSHEALHLSQKEIEIAIHKLQAEREEKIQSLSRLGTLLENHEEKLRMSSANQELLQNQSRSETDRLTRLEHEKGETAIRISGLRQESVQLEEKLKLVEERQKEVEVKLSDVRMRKTFYAHKHNEIRTEREGIDQRVANVKESLHQQELTLMQLGYGERTIFERMEQTYHVRLSEFKAEDFIRAGLDPAELEEQIGRLKGRVESFGPVNLLAEEEYQELKQRHDFLATQEKDLNDARESLLEAIRKINRTTKTLFAETFARAQALFQEYYQTLFDGGHAELTLLESEEAEEAGIEIMVRPPGKKPQHISLLSGGEKALTGIALLFALFKIKPSPLCVLDEVDAPLDEANVERFLNVLRTFLDSTQFLIMTHNRKTIAMGDYLYGVTMEESGVSKMVSVKVTASAAIEKVPAPA